MDQAQVDQIGPEAPPQHELASDESAYLLRDRIDIVAVLRDLVKSRTLATVHFGSRQETLLTALLVINTAAGEIVFDCSGSPNLNRAVMRANRLLFFSSQDKIKVRFTTGPAQRVQHDGREAFCVRLPESMLRLQRREFYRVLAPIARPLRCVIPVVEESSTRHVQTRLHDISQGGIAVVAQPGELTAGLGAQYPNCRIVLPESGNVIVTLQTVYAVDIALLNAKTVVRIGCKFVRPSMSALALIQRFMMKLERENKARD